MDLFVDFDRTAVGTGGYATRQAYATESGGDVWSGCRKKSGRHNRASRRRRDYAPRDMRQAVFR